MVVRQQPTCLHHRRQTEHTRAAETLHFVDVRELGQCIQGSPMRTVGWIAETSDAHWLRAYVLWNKACAVWLGVCP